MLLDHHQANEGAEYQLQVDIFTIIIEPYFNTHHTGASDLYVVNKRCLSWWLTTSPFLTFLSSCTTWTSNFNYFIKLPLWFPATAQSFRIQCYQLYVGRVTSSRMYVGKHTKCKYLWRKAKKVSHFPHPAISVGIQYLYSYLSSTLSCGLVCRHRMGNRIIIKSARGWGIWWIQEEKCRGWAIMYHIITRTIILVYGSEARNYDINSEYLRMFVQAFIYDGMVLSSDHDGIAGCYCCCCWVMNFEGGD